MRAGKVTDELDRVSSGPPISFESSELSAEPGPDAVDLQARDFRREIIEAGIAQAKGMGRLSPLPQLTSLFAFVASAVYSIDWLNNLYYHILGFAMTYGAVIVDRYLVETRIASSLRDRRFSDYGLLPYFQSEYPFLLRRRMRLWSSLLDLKPIAKTLFAGLLPPYGVSILAILPFHYLEVRKETRIIVKSFQVGDEVERMIKAGRTEDEIRSRLSQSTVS